MDSTGEREKDTTRKGRAERKRIEREKKPERRVLLNSLHLRAQVTVVPMWSMFKKKKKTILSIFSNGSEQF